jgi:ribosome biogenesis GTPase
LRYTAKNRSDLPAVGDWVAISEFDEGKALIHSIYPRYSLIERQAVGKLGQKQIIAANIDFGLIVQAVNRDFNINRLERYLTICNTSNVEPVIVLSKIDLIDDFELETLLNKINQRIKDIPVVAISNESLVGLDKLTTIITKGKTYCLLGSSGVGKSTLINKMAGTELMKTSAISKSIDRGKHVTSHRELIVLENGGILIDNPGLREVGITDTDIGLELTFDAIIKLSKKCKFNDCTHINEKGCAILEAIDKEEIDKDSYENFQKLQREKTHYESSIRERRKKDKDFGKMIKNYKKDRNQDKY